MPALDRRITVRVSVSGRNEYGEHETATTDYPVWATRVDRSQRDKEEQGGVLTEPNRAYTIRHRREIADALTSQLSIVDPEDGGRLVLNATNVVEQTLRGARRRFLRIEGTGEETTS